MTTIEPALNDLAVRLRDAYGTYEPIEPVRDELASGGIDAAYRVQRTNTDHWVAQGRRIVGRKIGLTSEAVQRQLGVDQPDFGALFDDMHIPDGGTIPYAAVLQPRAEAEVAFVLSRPIEDPAVTVGDLAHSIDHLVAAIEIVGSRIAGWDITILDTIADNASSGMFVLGSVDVDPAGLDLANVTMRMSLDGELVSEGTGAACLGHPFNAGVWLARRMIAEGTPLQTGDIILSGALGPMQDLTAGSTAVAEIDGLGSVTVAREGAPA